MYCNADNMPGYVSCKTQCKPCARYTAGIVRPHYPMPAIAMDALFFIPNQVILASRAFELEVDDERYYYDVHTWRKL